MADSCTDDPTTALPDNDMAYFSSYDDISVHKTMLKDSARVQAYKHFIENNTDAFANKIVIDVGSGSGILSLLAARAGAKHVYAIEAAANVAALSRDIIELNGYTSQITVLIGRTEDVELPDGVLADVLISEWMGFYLLHESMLDAIIAARDRLLRPDGAIFPSTATLYACPISVKEFYRENVLFWRNAYGFDFSPVAAVLRSTGSPEIMSITPESLLAIPQSVLSLDLRYVDVEDFRHVLTSLDFVAKRNDVMHGFALWFDVHFDGAHPSTLDTSPSAPETHWRQTVVLLPTALLVNNAAEIQCTIHLQQDDENHRRYNITIEMPEDEEDSEEEGSETSEGVEKADMDVCPEDIETNTTNSSSAELKELLLRTMDRVV